MRRERAALFFCQNRAWKSHALVHKPAHIQPKGLHKTRQNAIISPKNRIKALARDSTLLCGKGCETAFGKFGQCSVTVGQRGDPVFIGFQAMKKKTFLICDERRQLCYLLSHVSHVYIEQDLSCPQHVVSGHCHVQTPHTTSGNRQCVRASGGTLHVG